ncbi:hypothetical protein ACS0TY_020679 [Phlomoides rotata]
MINSSTKPVGQGCGGPGDEGLRLFLFFATLERLVSEFLEVILIARSYCWDELPFVVEITEAEETWNLGKNLGIKSLETDPAMRCREKEKMREVRELISKLRIEICCLQETKMEEVNKRVDDGNYCTIVNVYGPNSMTQRSELWEILHSLVMQTGTTYLCITGDFNTIREESERVGRAGQGDRSEMERFNNFIEGSDLVKIQLVGRKFTWYRPDGTCKSKLDRMFVNSNWLNKWPGEILRCGKRSLPYHIPIYIEGIKKDWGPRPFKFFNQWIQHPSYKDLAETVWTSSSKQGWTGYVIKEKLKELKAALKE